MDQSLDPRMQRILKDAANYTGQIDQAASFNYASRSLERSQTDFGFAPASRQATRESVSITPFGA